MTGVHPSPFLKINFAILIKPCNNAMKKDAHFINISISISYKYSFGRTLRYGAKLGVQEWIECSITSSSNS